MGLGLRHFVLGWLPAALLAAIEPPKPGWNLFSAEQDIQLGKEARVQVERRMPVVHNSGVSAYLTEMGQRLARSRYAGRFPYTFELVADKNVNAFSLPGGPVFINTGLIATAENEAQMAGVIAHEMSHIALRHATNQASKANLIRLPAILLGAATGNGILGSLAQAGIGLGANSILLKFSRSAESEADYNAVLIMADAGYNPIELARFFEKLEAQTGRQGSLSQFLSDHPNPGNRVQAIETEIRQLPQRQYTTDTGQFERVKDQVRHLPAHGQLRSDFQDEHAEAPPEIRPVSSFRDYNANGYSIRFPGNWEAFGDGNSAPVTFAPRDAVFQSQNGGTPQIGYGSMISYYFPPGDRIELRRDTEAVIAKLAHENSGLRQRDQRRITIGGEQGLLTTLNSQSPYRNNTEVDGLVTVPRPEGLFYIVFIAPSSEWSHAEPVFQEMMRSVRFH